MNNRTNRTDINQSTAQAELEPQQPITGNVRRNFKPGPGRRVPILPPPPGYDMNSQKLSSKRGRPVKEAKEARVLQSASTQDKATLQSAPRKRKGNAGNKRKQLEQTQEATTNKVNPPTFVDLTDDLEAFSFGNITIANQPFALTQEEQINNPQQVATVLPIQTPMMLGAEYYQVPMVQPTESNIEAMRAFEHYLDSLIQSPAASEPEPLDMLEQNDFNPSAIEDFDDASLFIRSNVLEPLPTNIPEESDVNLDSILAFSDDIPVLQTLGTEPEHISIEQDPFFSQSFLGFFNETRQEVAQANVTKEQAQDELWGDLSPFNPDIYTGPK